MKSMDSKIVYELNRGNREEGGGGEKIYYMLMKRGLSNYNNT